MTAAVVVVYHPQVEEVLNNIRTYADAVDKVLVWRNSEEEFAVPEDLAGKLLLLGERKNDYMAKPLNSALAWCKENGYDYLLTMDQDSKWENAAYYVSRALSSSDRDVALYSPFVVGQYDKPDADYDAESVITSGSLVNVAIADKLGGFREDYKIYWVDGEFCYWARKNGYRIRVLHDCPLYHRFGDQTRTLFGFTASNYAPIIYYFLIRNMLWMKREFPDGVSFKTVLYTLMCHVRGIVLGERQKLCKLHHINKGIVHGLFHKFSRRTACL